MAALDLARSRSRILASLPAGASFEGRPKWQPAASPINLVVVAAALPEMAEIIFQRYSTRQALPLTSASNMHKNVGGGVAVGRAENDNWHRHGNNGVLAGEERLVSCAVIVDERLQHIYAIMSEARHRVI